MFIVGNKCDDADRRVVVQGDAKRFAEQMNIQYFETSAKENVNIEEVDGLLGGKRITRLALIQIGPFFVKMFNAITRLVLQAKKAQQSQSQPTGPGGIRVDGRREGKPKKSCC